MSPLYESVPPRLYGGTERVVSFLTEELVRQGHKVTLFASGDSVTSAELVAVCPEALRLNGNCVDGLAPHILQVEQVLQRAAEFDVVHFHTDYFHYPTTRRAGLTHLTTLHGRLDIPELQALYEEFRDVPLISISQSQRDPLPGANWQGTVYHGIPRNLYHAGDGSGGYLAFLGRISPEKRLDRAVLIARQAGLPLKICAKLDKADRKYYDDNVRGLLKNPGVEFLGEVGDEAKIDFLGQAVALLFPIDWPEPFGLTMIEAMACGTPVIAFRRGSVPEVVDDGVTGIIVDTMEEAARAVERAAGMSRRRVRRRFELRFTAERMACDYLAAYDRALNGEAEASLSAA